MGWVPGVVAEQRCQQEESGLVVASVTRAEGTHEEEERAKQQRAKASKLMWGFRLDLNDSAAGEDSVDCCI